MALKTLTKTFKLIVDDPVSAEMQNLMTPRIAALDVNLNTLYKSSAIETTYILV